MGLFADFVGDEERAADRRRGGRQGARRREHGATMLRGRPGILHGAETYVLQDADGQISESWSVSAGLDYPAVGPEHAFLKDSGRAEYVGATDARRSTPSPCSRGPRGSSAPSNPPTLWPMR
jgi:tryptophan synthase beta chain